jgi:CBS domain containing-hemolysin-like protein
VTVVRDDLLEVDGDVAVRELNSRYRLSLPESGDYVTIAGLLLARLGSVPTGGRKHHDDGRAQHRAREDREPAHATAGIAQERPLRSPCRVQ